MYTLTDIGKLRVFSALDCSIFPWCDCRSYILKGIQLYIWQIIGVLDFPLSSLSATWCIPIREINTPQTTTGWRKKKYLPEGIKTGRKVEIHPREKKNISEYKYQNGLRSVYHSYNQSYFSQPTYVGQVLTRLQILWSLEIFSQ